MKDIDLLVALFDDLQSHGFIEPCEFLEIEGVAGGVMKSWRFKPRLSVCGVFSLPAAWDDPASLIAFLGMANRVLCRDHRRRAQLGLLNRNFILSCHSALFNRTCELIHSKKSSPLSHMFSLILLDREGFTCFPVPKLPKLVYANLFETMVFTTSKWCVRHRREMARDNQHESQHI